MAKAIIKIIDPANAITAVGKIFTGNYLKSPQFVSEVESILNSTSTLFIKNKVLGVYYDNPEKVKTEELTCFQGVFLQNAQARYAPILTKLALKGKYLYTQVSGDSSNIIREGYNAIFSHIQENGVALKSNAGYQVSTFENNKLSIEIYMEIL